MSTATRKPSQNLSPTRTRNPVYHYLYVPIMPSTRFRVSSHSIVTLKLRNLFLQKGMILEARSVWPNSSVFVYDLSGCEFESRCSLPVYHHHERIKFLSKKIPSSGI